MLHGLCHGGVNGGGATRTRLVAYFKHVSHYYVNLAIGAGRRGGGTPYIQMIGIIVVFQLGVVIGDLVFFRGCSSKIL